jgi:hypothetical protein
MNQTKRFKQFAVGISFAIALSLTACSNKETGRGSSAAAGNGGYRVGQPEHRVHRPRPSCPTKCTKPSQQPGEISQVVTDSGEAV